MGRKYTRKQLKKPDEFISLTHRAWDFVRVRARGTVITIVVAVLVIVAAAAFNAYRERRAEKASHALARALEIYDLPVGEAAPARDGGDDLPRFKTRKEKLERVEKDLSAVVDGPGIGDIPRLARLARGGVRYELGRFADAAADFEAALAGEEDVTVRYAASEGRLYALEGQKKWDAALAQAKRLPNDGDDAEARRLYHQARILEQQGKKKEALELFRKARDEAKSMLLKAFAGTRVALLDA